VRYYLAPLWLTLAEMEGEPKPEGGGFPRWLIILIVVVVALVALLCCVILFVPVVLTMMGPSIGNVFSNIIEEMVTPTP
jgi:hypothetical protein